MRQAIYRGQAPDGAFAFEAGQACRARELLASIGLSRPVIARAFEAGQLRRAGQAGMQGQAGAQEGAGLLGPGAPLSAGEVVLLEPRVTREAGPTSRKPARILWEDAFALAADKPQGLLVHGDGTSAETLTARVQGYLAAQADPSGSAPPHSKMTMPHTQGAGRRGVQGCVSISATPEMGHRMSIAQACQRLDVDTSGLVLFSKTEEFQPLFDALVARHGMGDGGIEKRYLALVRGVFPQKRAILRDPIGRDRHDARRMRVSAGGQAALTKVELMGIVHAGTQGAPYSLLQVTLGTGRRHQIRVHLAAHGFPLVNDPLYGSPDHGAFKGRGLMLHAWQEEFIHPVTGELACIETSWPARFPRLG